MRQISTATRGGIESSCPVMCGRYRPSRDGVKPLMLLGFPSLHQHPSKRTLLACLFAVSFCARVRAQERIVYRLEPQPRTPQELAKQFTPEQIDILEMLNRRDRLHLTREQPRVAGMVVPSAWSGDPLVYSPFPSTWRAAETFPKIVVVHQPAQAFAAYEAGKLVRWGPVSTGRKDTPTPEGTFNLTWRARSRRSTDNQDWLLEWYFNFVNERGVSFHLFELPGYPASHACVRLLLRDAQWLYGWGDQWRLDDTRRNVTTPGTAVLVLGTYPYGSPPMWLSLDSQALPLELPAVLPAAPAR